MTEISPAPSRRRVFHYAGASGLMFAAPAILRAQGKRPAEIAIGALCSLSGAAAAFGAGGRAAFEIRVDEINKAGGLWGDGTGRLRLDVVDDQSKPDIAVAEVARLARGADLMAVTVLAPSASTMQGTLEGERRKLSIVNTGGAAGEINERGLKYTFSTCANWNAIIASALAFAREVTAGGPAPGRCAFIYENKYSGPFARRALEPALAKGDWKMAGDYPYDPATTDFSPLVARLKADGIDFPFVYSYPQDAILLIRAMAEQKYDPLAFVGVTGGMANVEFATTAGNTADYLMGQSPYLHSLKSPGNAEFVAAFKAKTGRMPDNVAGQAYCGMSAIALAIKQAVNPLDRDSVRQAMADLDVPGGRDGIIIPGGVKFDKTGSNPASQGCFYQIRNGVHEVVLPAEFATTKAVYPRPKWAEYAK